MIWVALAPTNHFSLITFTITDGFLNAFKGLWGPKSIRGSGEIEPVSLEIARMINSVDISLASEQIQLDLSQNSYLLEDHCVANRRISRKKSTSY